VEHIHSTPYKRNISGLHIQRKEIHIWTLSAMNGQSESVIIVMLSLLPILILHNMTTEVPTRGVLMASEIFTPDGCPVLEPAS